MKIIQANSITNINELKNSGGWYWGTDYTSGDLYEAEELFRTEHEISSNLLIFLHFPEVSLFRLSGRRKHNFPLGNGKVLYSWMDADCISAVGRKILNTGRKL